MTPEDLDALITWFHGFTSGLATAAFMWGLCGLGELLWPALRLARRKARQAAQERLQRIRSPR